VRREWRKLSMEPTGLHESRHSAATWLDHAGVSPKVASTLMGHKGELMARRFLSPRLSPRGRCGSGRAIEPRNGRSSNR